MSASNPSNISKLFNNKQRQVISYNNRVQPDILILDGAVRSGKTVCGLTIWLADIWQKKNKKLDFILTGHSLGSLERNIFRPLMDLYGFKVCLNKMNGFGLFGNMVYCFGSDKADSHEAMQGMTAAGHYGNEVTLSHERSIKEAMDRCSVPGARFIWEMNPLGPNHYIYRNFIESAIKNGNSKKLARFPWSIYDNSIENNGFLTPEYISREENIHQGIFFKQRIKGEWTAIDGQIYFLEQLQFYNEESIKQNWFNGTIIHGYLDPATGSRKKTGCYTAIITACLKNDNFYILDCQLKKLGVNDTISTAGRLLQKYNYSRFAVEDNFSQDEYIVKPLRSAWPSAPIYGQSSREDKLSRIIGMHGVVTSRVFFPERFLYERPSDGWLLLQQLCNISAERSEKAEHDEEMLDGPDALEGLIRTYKNYRGGGGRAAAAGGDDVKEKQEW